MKHYTANTLRSQKHWRTTYLCRWRQPLIIVLMNRFRQTYWRWLKLFQFTKLELNKIPNNYRPSSLISNIARYWIKSYTNEYYNFVNRSKIISNRQYGFLINKITNYAPNIITREINENLKKSKPIAMAFQDLSKAIDTPNHIVLLRK